MRWISATVFGLCLSGCASMSPEQRIALAQAFQQQSFQQKPYVMPVNQPTTTTTNCQNLGYGQVSCTSRTY